MKHLRPYNENLEEDEIRDILNIASDEGYESKIEKIYKKKGKWVHAIWLFDPIGDNPAKAFEVFKDVINRLQHTITLEKYSILAHDTAPAPNHRVRNYPYVTEGGRFVGLDQLITRMEKSTSSHGVRLYYNQNG